MHFNASLCSLFVLNCETRGLLSGYDGGSHIDFADFEGQRHPNLAWHRIDVGMWCGRMGCLLRRGCCKVEVVSVQSGLCCLKLGFGFFGSDRVAQLVFFGSGRLSRSRRCGSVIPCRRRQIPLCSRNGSSARAGRDWDPCTFFLRFPANSCTFLSPCHTTDIPQLHGPGLGTWSRIRD